MSEAAVDKPQSGRRRILRILAAVALLPALLLLFFGWVIVDLTSGFRAPYLEGKPVAARARGPGFVVRDFEGLPVMFCNGLPTPTPFESTQRPSLSLDGDWELQLDEGDRGLSERWYSEELDWPGSELSAVPGTYNASLSKHAGHQGLSWFRRKFEAPTELARWRWRLDFEAVLLRARVWLNGTELGTHEGGYTGFWLDASKAIRAGENLLVVRVDNQLEYHSLPPKAREGYRPGWAVYGGITRSVKLVGLPPRALIKVACETIPEGASWRLRAAIASEGGLGAFKILATLRGPRGAFITRSELASEGGSPVCVQRLDWLIKDPELWEPENPRLYELELSLDAGERRDLVKLAVGLREVTIKSSEILLNGRSLRLLGAAKHEDHPQYGASNPPALISEDFKKIKDLGANYMRLAHYPHALAELREARRVGLLVSEEIPLYHAGMGWIQWLWKGKSGEPFPAEHFGSRQIFDPELLGHAQQQLIELIERDRNNPAVILWSVGNENYSLDEDSGRAHAWLREVCKAWDPSRPVTMAEWTAGTDWIDERRHASDAMDIISLNMYPGWYFGAAEDAGALLDAARKRWPDRPILLSEFGAGAALGRKDEDGIVETGITPRNKTFSESYQAEVLRKVYEKARQRAYVRGITPWVFADFSCPWFVENPVPGYNLKGLLSKDREEKESFRLMAELFSKDLAQSPDGPR